MPKAPSLLTSPKTKKLATKALKSPSMMTTVETRELGASVMAHLQPPAAIANGVSNASVKKTAVKKMAGKKSSAKRT